MRRTILTRAGLAVATGAALTMAGTPAAQAAPTTPAATTAADRAAEAADAAVGAPGAATALRRADGDALSRTGVVAGTNGLHYVTYARTHKGLPVVGGDVVVSTNAAGAVTATSVAQNAAITVDTRAAVSAGTATATATSRLAAVDESSAAKLVVLAWGASPKLTWETVVTGREADNKPTKLHVFVDAKSGAVIDTYDEVREGTGNGYYYGNVTIDTSRSGSSFSMTDGIRPGLRCGGQSGTAYTGTDDAWGNGSGTDLETACVDAMWGAQREVDMLTQWFGRNGVLGNGNNPPIRVGLADVNAYWNGSYVNFGHNQANDRQATPIDVVGHELGHAIFQNTPGGTGSGNENGGINEATGDIFGAMSEAFANSPLDPPDYQVGEEVDLVGQGPIRYMYDPSLAGDPNCYSSAIPSTEVHAAAGPLNHWFYLLAEGSAPGGGKPSSPTCNNSSVTGLSIQTAGKIYYNAMLMKTSTWKYVNIRTATLNAAKNLFPTSCTEFNSVKAAWNAVSVPAQAGEATCTIGNPGDDFSIAASPTSGSVAPGSSATTTVSTATTSGSAQTVALTASGLPTGATATFSPASVTSGNSSTLTIATSASTPAGTYPVTITGTGAITRTATYALTVTGTGGGCAGTNGTAVAIPDAGSAVTSTITIGGCARRASTTSSVAVNIAHTYRGDLVIDLVAPDGSSYRLKNSSAFDSADNVNTTYTANLGSEAADGAWKLSVRDVYSSDTGRINTWTLTL